MATITAVVEGRGGTALVTWETLTSSDVGSAYAPLDTSGAVACVQMTGTFGAAVVMQGSNDGTNWFTLKDMSGNDVSLTAAGLVDFSTAAQYIRPSAGAVTDVDVILSVKLR